ncbi:Thioredoxin-like family protein [[Mycoplasma] cavipharyngis]|uniref:hypothetical protein n=1 Tax=[Mycoplasma] cavipharyngis TaxID=92757 RepID=UPI003704B496
MTEFKLLKLSALEKILDQKDSLTKPLLVLFKWDQCSYCIDNVPKIETELNSSQFSGLTDNYCIDTDSEKIWAEDGLNSRWKINVTPTYQMYDVNKKLVFEQQGPLSLETLSHVFKKIIRE